MYTIANAATLLGVAESTVRRWIRESNIPKTLVQTNRTRVYIAYSDVLVLADKYRPLKVHIDKPKQTYQDLSGLYSTNEVARLFGVKSVTAHKWIIRSGIETKIITTDRKRAYISHDGLVTLARQHHVSIPYADKAQVQDHGLGPASFLRDSSPPEEKLYTIADAALLLDTTPDCVRRWISLYHIEKQTVEVDKKHIYLAYDDIMLLQSKCNRHATYNVNIATNLREINIRLEKIEAAIVRLEKYIKRSVYLGT